MTIKGRFLLVIALVAVSLMILATPPVFSQECKEVPGTRYNVENIDRWLSEAEQFLRGCSGGNNNCKEADKRLEEADVAIVQILTECTKTGNCRRGEINIISDRAGRLADLSRLLVRQSGMRRTYDNTVITVNSWRSTKRCPEARCQQYARTAVSQNQENIRRKCGYTGDRWTNEYQGHYKWCAGAHRSFADIETRARAEALKKCQYDLKQRCQQYARTAVSQNQENIRRKCGYTGDRWTNEYQGHYKWCAGAHRSFADIETRARAEALKKCQPKPVSCPGPGMTVIHKFVEPPPWTGVSVICRDGSGKLWMQGANPAPIASLVRGQWNSQTGCYDRSKIVTSSRTLEGRLCKP